MIKKTKKIKINKQILIIFMILKITITMNQNQL